jgi:aspartokinase
MSEKKLKAYQVVYHQYLTLIRMGFFKERRICPLGDICSILGRREIPVHFLASTASFSGDFTFHFGVELLSDERTELLLDDLSLFENRKELSLISQIAMSLIYGPHFGEMPGVLALFLRTLENSGVTTLALSASASSLSCLFPAVQFKVALESLSAIFESPSAYYRENSQRETASKGEQP